LREQLKVLEQQAERQLLGQLEACALAWPALASAEDGDWLSQLSGGAAALAALQWLRGEAKQT
jgi:Ser/Thr protein kinase RdoA (MazF antagonist)